MPDFAALKAPRAVACVVGRVAVAAVDVDDLAGEAAVAAACRPATSPAAESGSRGSSGSNAEQRTASERHAMPPAAKSHHERCTSTDF